MTANVDKVKPNEIQEILSQTYNIPNAYALKKNVKVTRKIFVLDIRQSTNSCSVIHTGKFSTQIVLPFIFIAHFLTIALCVSQDL